MPTLTDQILGSDQSNNPPVNVPSTQGSLTEQFLTPSEQEIMTHKAPTAPNANLGSNFASGVGDVVHSIASGIGFLDQLFNSNAKVNLDTGQVEVTGPGKDRYDAFKQYLTQRNEAANKVENQSGALGSAARTAGQIVGTAPFIKGPFKSVDYALGSKLPVTGGGFAQGAAAIGNKLSSAVIKGGIAGGEFGAATSAANQDQNLGQSIGGGITVGAATGPFFELANIGGKGLINNLSNWYKTGKVSGGLNQDAINYMLNKFQEAGFTPNQVKAELSRLGPNATIADIDPLFLDTAETIAKSGGPGSSMMKGRYALRADEADNRAMNMFEQNLGGVPDLDVARQRIIDNARQATASDYQKAYASNEVLDAQPIIDNINDQLQTAVGSKQKSLNTAKSYLYHTVQDVQGNNTSIPRYTIQDLHETRMGLDDLIERAKSPVTSAGKNALRALTDVRGQVDDLLKTDPNMQAADKKYAQQMDIAKGLDIGQDAFNNKTNYNQFYRLWVNSSPEVQETIKQGARAAIGNMMAGNAQGELSASQKLFEKKSTNRDKFTLMFGKNAEDTLDAIQNQLNFRRTERTIEGGSRTAQIQSIQQELGIRPQSGSILGEAAKGAMFDVLAGTPAVASGISAVRQAGTKGLASYRSYQMGNKLTDIGDILSRQGNERDNAINILNKVQTIRNQSQASPDSLLRLPVTLPVAIKQGIDRASKNQE